MTKTTNGIHFDERRCLSLCMIQNGFLPGVVSLNRETPLFQLLMHRGLFEGLCLTQEFGTPTTTLIALTIRQKTLRCDLICDGKQTFVACACVQGHHRMPSWPTIWTHRTHSSLFARSSCLLLIVILHFWRPIKTATGRRLSARTRR